MPTQETINLAAEMNGVASVVTRATNHAARTVLSKDAAALAAMIGVLSYIRVEGLNEQAILKEAQRSVPLDRFAGPQ